MKCPTCDVTFEKGKLYGVPIRQCPSCGGLLIVQRFLLNVLDPLSLEIANQVSVDQRIAPLPDKEEQRDCPSCEEKMEAYGYLGTKTVIIDSCTSCKHLFLDKLELGVMATLYAKTNKRAEIRKIERASIRSDLVGTHVMQEAVSRAFMLGYILG